MPSGGARTGSGRKRKPAAQKLLEGNPGRRAVQILNFSGDTELPEEPPSYLPDRAKDIYRKVHQWLKKIDCTSGILPYNLEEYAFCKARWLECEEKNTQHGLLVKDNSGKPMPSPFVLMAQNYLRQTNEVWAKIYAVIRESKLKEWDNKNPNDDIMERLLSSPPKS